MSRSERRRAASEHRDFDGDVVTRGPLLDLRTAKVQVATTTSAAHPIALDFYDPMGSKPPLLWTIEGAEELLELIREAQQRFDGGKKALVGTVERVFLPPREVKVWVNRRRRGPIFIECRGVNVYDIGLSVEGAELLSHYLAAAIHTASNPQDAAPPQDEVRRPSE